MAGINARDTGSWVMCRARGIAANCGIVVKPGYVSRTGGCRKMEVGVMAGFVLLVNSIFKVHSNFKRWRGAVAWRYSLVTDGMRSIGLCMWEFVEVCITVGMAGQSVMACKCAL